MSLTRFATFLFSLFIAHNASSATLPAICGSGTYNREITVATGSQLQSALNVAQPGDLILLAPGTYTGRFVATRSGTASARITVCGAGDATLDSGSTTSGYGFHVRASYLTLTGFNVRRAMKGIVLDSANYNLLRRLTVSDIGHEGVHFRTHSSYNVLQDSVVTNTGLARPDIGEGVYVGSAVGNWDDFGDVDGDKSNFNQILRNRITQTRAECIDIKEGTKGTLVEGNYFDGTHLSGLLNADSWVDVKGNDAIIRKNTGRNSGSVLKNGYETHVNVSGTGQRPRFEANDSDVNGPGYAIWAHNSSLGTVVTCDNTYANAGYGLSNVKCSSTTAPAPSPSPAPMPKPSATPLPTATPLPSPTPSSPTTDVNFATLSRVKKVTALDTNQTVDNLFDGCTSSDLSCVTGSTSYERFDIEFDLGAIRTLSALRLFGDTIAPGISKSFTILTKSNSSDGYKTFKYGVPANTSAWVELHMNAHKARYIKLRIYGATGSGSVQARELQIFGR